MGCGVSAANRYALADASKTHCKDTPHLQDALLSSAKVWMPLGLSTEEIHAVPVGVCPESYALHPPYAKYRAGLDYTYHWHYSIDRQKLQDSMIERAINAGDLDPENVAFRQWVVFTAGAMGAGKGYVIRWMCSEGYFPGHLFTVVDPDEIRSQLPEWSSYVKYDSASAGKRTQKEAGLIAEVLCEAALEARHNVLIDGSLRDADWYSTYFDRLRDRYPGVRIAILHVVAPLEMVKHRSFTRSQLTGRTVPDDVLDATVQAVPVSVQRLAPLCDFCVRIENRDDGIILEHEPGSVHPPPGIEIHWDLVGRIWTAGRRSASGALTRGEAPARMPPLKTTQQMPATYYQGIRQHIVHGSLNCLIAAAFPIFDRNGDGKICRKDLFGLLLSLRNGQPHDEEVDALLKDADVDRDGAINYKEFVDWVLKGDAGRATVSEVLENWDVVTASIP